MSTAAPSSNVTGDFAPLCGACGYHHWGSCPYTPWQPDWRYWPAPAPEPLYGWICPRCLRVWAPSVTECQHCRPAITNISSGGTIDCDTNVTVMNNLALNESAPESGELQHDTD
jgi:hypothetical protein